MACRDAKYTSERPYILTYGGISNDLIKTEWISLRLFLITEIEISADRIHICGVFEKF